MRPTRGCQREEHEHLKLKLLRKTPITSPPVLLLACFIPSAPLFEADHWVQIASLGWF